MDEPRPPRKRRQPRKASATYLERAALHHLQRYSTTRAGLQRVLLRRVDRSARAHGTDPAEGRALVESLLDRFERAGLLDDRRFAHARADSLLRKGTSLRGIAAKLGARGVPAALVRESVTELKERGPDTELEAAFALARRRRLGPYRPEDKRKERRDKDLAALARAGFSFSIARKVIESTEAP